jgi:hypothetical protein
MVQGPGISIYKVPHSLDRLSGFQEVEAPKFQEIWHVKVVRFSVLRISRQQPQEIFLVLIFVRVWVTSEHSLAGSITWMRNSYNIIGNQTSDLPACSVVPQTMWNTQFRHCKGRRQRNWIFRFSKRRKCHLKITEFSDVGRSIRSRHVFRFMQKLSLTNKRYWPFQTLVSAKIWYRHLVNCKGQRCSNCTVRFSKWRT